MASFEIAGEPKGVADEGEMPPREAASASRPSKKRPAKDDTSDSEVGPDEDELAYARGADKPWLGPPSSGNLPVATAEPSLEVSHMLLPSPTLSLKSENIVRRLSGKDDVQFDRPPYEVDWESSLGAGTFGTIYEARVTGVANHPVAVKIFKGRNMMVQAQRADAEVRRYVAFPSHPHILKLLDIGLFAAVGRGLAEPPSVGLIFDRYDADLRQFLEQTQMTVTGMRHVLRSSLSALHYMHELGVVHADLKPDNILLRGAGSFKESWRRLFGPEARGAASSRGAASARGDGDMAAAVEISHHLPASFEVAHRLHMKLRTTWFHTAFYFRGAGEGKV